QRELVSQNVGQLDTALYNLSRATLTAPIDGPILELSHKVGERIRGSDLSEDVAMLMGGITDLEGKAEVGEHEWVAVHNVLVAGNQAVTSRDAKKKEEKAAPREGEIKVAGSGGTTAAVAANGKDDPPTKAATGKPKPVKVVFVVDKDGVAQMREVQTGIA